MSEYPEHDKMAAVQDRSQVIGAFLDDIPNGVVLAQWVCGYVDVGEGVEENARVHARHIAERHENGEPGGACERAKLVPANERIERLLAAYFGIDLTLIEREKRAMLASIGSAR